MTRFDDESMPLADPTLENRTEPDLDEGCLQEQNDPARLRSLVATERRYVTYLVGLVQSLEQQLQTMASSRWWRLLETCRRLRSWVHQKKVSWYGKILFAMSRPGRKLMRRGLAVVCKQLYLLLEENAVAIVPNGLGAPLRCEGRQDAYAVWRACNAPRIVELHDYAVRLRQLRFRPKIAILMPVSETSLDDLQETIQSIRQQVYANWELCIADNARDPGVRDAIATFAEEDPRVRVTAPLGNSSHAAALNDALARSTGDYVAMLDPGDRLSPDALYQYVLSLNEDRTQQFLYADEDRIDERGDHVDPTFKPDWCPDNLLTHNYIGRVFLARYSLVQALGGFRERYEGAHDHDLVLRLTERTQRIGHIPRVLCHRRARRCADSGANLATRAVLTEALDRRGEPGEVTQEIGLSRYCVRYKLQRPGKVSILLPTKDQPKVLEACLHSLFTLTQYRDFEVLLIDNNSVEEKTHDLLERYRRLHGDRFRVLDQPVRFNFSRLMNAGAAEASGPYLLLLNNDTEVLDGDWLGAMVEQAQRPAIGCVGAQLLYTNRTVQHAGVVLGHGRSVAGHLMTGVRPDDPQYRHRLHAISNFSAVTAACLMVRREVFHELGGFDEDFAVDYNDVDFCLRVREAGYQNIYLPHVVLYHHESLTRGHPLAGTESALRHRREELLLRERWPAYIENDPCLSLHLTLEGVGESPLRLERQPPAPPPPAAAAPARPIARAA